MALPSNPMDKPKTTYPTHVPPSTQSFMPPQIPDPSIKGVSFDQLLNNRGIKFIHKRALPCPNMSQLDDNNHIADCPVCDDSGLIYYGDREIWGVFVSNSVEKTFEHQGIWEIGTAVVTFPAEYDNGDQADFNTYDEVAIPDFEVRLWELKQYEVTPNDRQALRYPIIKVDFMAIVIDDELIPLIEDVDFKITDGEIEWLPGHTPPINPANESGAVFTVSYYANPIYKVLQPLRELRITQELDTVTGIKTARRLPQQILVKRDFLVSAGEKIVSGS